MNDNEHQKTWYSPLLSGLAVISLVLAILMVIVSLTVFLPPPEEETMFFMFYNLHIPEKIVFALIKLTFWACAICIAVKIGVKETRQSAGIRAIATAGVYIVCIPFFFLVFIGAHSRASLHGRSCFSNLKQLGTAINMYGQDYDNHFPPLDRWNDVLYPYIKNIRIFYCPKAPNLGIPNYAMNKLLKGLSEDDVAMPDKTVLLFESIPINEFSGGPELLPIKPRHKKGHHILFTDGHVKQIPESQLGELNWLPKYKEPEYITPGSELY